jgi:hypothetical protein
MLVSAALSGRARLECLKSAGLISSFRIDDDGRTFVTTLASVRFHLTEIQVGKDVEIKNIDEATICNGVSQC